MYLLSITKVGLHNETTIYEYSTIDNLFTELKKWFVEGKIGKNDIIRINEEHKQMFDRYCKYFYKELQYLKEDIEFENSGTLQDLGEKMSYELANIGFELGYASWQFYIGNDFEKAKNEFSTMIIENEKIVGCYSDDKLEEIKERIERCKQNE